MCLFEIDYEIRLCVLVKLFLPHLLVIDIKLEKFRMLRRLYRNLFYSLKGLNERPVVKMWVFLIA